ncbi:zinc metallochaperone AztD [Modestobacter sp. VKM Ac-2986]|uniref:zinc metallochaperone AztD n=1 Tax=Modestobacter sp. VKM Ac-2986 TaxID=3004140 RepID=UPI0022AB3873|nr:zinc metallochaperone AztD [Modestobacter sp. VKM Ac-2986]MCZ2827594.1 zinc metallochaperone AztD [Modestobacter sp. VKM Ac-2986]
MTSSRTSFPVGVAGVGVAALLLTGCSSDSSAAAGTPSAAPSAAAVSEAAAEVPAAQPRLTLTYDGGLLVLDAATLEVVGDLPIEGFTRVNAAGDGRHALVTTEQGFQVLDAGVWTDGGTSYAGGPELTDDVFTAAKAGHVVVHGDRTILFADGTGDITSFETAALLDSEGLPETRSWESEAAHHGVAIELEDGTLLTTLGTEDGRTGVRVLDPAGQETARAENCPGVHGEGTVAGEVAVFGCEDGVLVYDGEFTKLDAPDEFGRTGNVFTTETSPVALGDYRSDPDAEGSLLSAVTLIDTAADRLQVVPLPEGVQYTFRDLARGPQDDAVLLGTDGAVHVMDETSGALLASHPVIDPWEGPAEWQDPHPAIKVHDGMAYVTEPAADAVHALDLATGEVVASVELDATPNELAVVAG